MTIMHHKLLDDQIIVGQIGDAFMQTQEYFSDKFYESDWRMIDFWVKIWAYSQFRDNDSFQKYAL